MVLAKRGEDFSIRVAGVELMNSRNHESEDELGRIACRIVDGISAPRVLIGGLGLGYTLRAVLDGAGAAATIDVVEIVPAVVGWNRTVTAALAGRALDDPRVTVIEDDVTRVIERSAAAYDTILLDVDNGPNELFETNAKLYKRNGLAGTRRALKAAGGLAVWSSFASPTFTRWLREVGFAVEIVTVKARGSRHYIWLART